MCDVPIDLKNRNHAYRKVINTLLVDYFSKIRPNGIFEKGYSPEYELGYRGGLIIFLFPEAEQKRRNECKRAMLREEDDNA
jgi:hypothetical protein